LYFTRLDIDDVPVLALDVHDEIAQLNQQMEVLKRLPSTLQDLATAEGLGSDEQLFLDVGTLIHKP
jgi:hypothetical protein